MIESVNVHPLQKAQQRQFLTLLLLGMLLVAGLLLGQWLWLTRTISAPPAEIVLPAERAPLLSALFRQKAIVWTLLSSAVIMLVAVLAGISPLSWWAHFLGLFNKAYRVKATGAPRWGQEPQSAEEWVAAQAALSGAPPAVLAAAAMQPGQQTPIPEQPQPGVPGAPGQPPPSQQPGVPPPPGQPQPPGAQQPGAPGQPQPPGAPLAPGQPPAAQQPGALPAPDAPAAQQPGAPGTPGAPGQPPPAPGQPPAPADPPQPGLQQLLATEEKMDIQELTDIGDILSSFKDNEDIPAQLLALSQSLDDVEIEALAAHSRRVAIRLAAANATPQQPAKERAGDVIGS